MMVQQVANYDQPVLALASRYPLLFRDLSQWVQANPQAAQLHNVSAPPASIRQNRRDLLFNHRQPESVLRRLGENPGQSVIQFFPQAADFLSFLTQPSAIDCISHHHWLPLLLLPLEHASHLQQWLLGIHPREWPWTIMDKRNFADDLTAQLAQSVGRQMLEFLRQIGEQTSERLTSRLIDRPTPGEILRENRRPLRVLAFAMERSVYQKYCARDLVDAMNACGIEARIAISDGPASHFELLEAIEAFDPDVLLLNGRDRTDCCALPRGLCVLAWDQDHALVTRPNYARNMAPRDLLMVMLDDWRHDAAEAGIAPGRIRHINLGANPRIYHPAVQPRKPEYDVLFIGNIHRFDDYRAAIGFDELEPPLQRLMLHARDRLAHWIRTRGDDESFIIPDIDPFLRACLAELGMNHQWGVGQWHLLVHYFRYRIAHLLVRELYISSLKDFRLGLFGNGWDAFPDLAPLARPEIENGEALREAIHRSAINLHLHTWTVHHPRLYDTAAAGGFLLVGRVPEAYPLERVFDVGGEVDSFGSIGELKRKIRHYLDHPEARARMAERAARRVVSEHTMEHRIGDMKRFLCEADYDQR